MKLNLLLTAFTLLTFSTILTAQSCANYTVTRNTGVTYTSINTGDASNFIWRNTTGNQNDDNRSYPANIGFDFWYLGTRYTTVSASLNGTIDFSSSTEDGNSGGARPYGPNYNNWFSKSNGTHLALAPMYDDLWTGGGGSEPIAASLIYKLSGTAPNRVLTVEWVNFDEYNSGTGSINFQIKLYETSGVIEFIYGTMLAGSEPYHYACGINSNWSSGSTTTKRLLTQQTANTTSFGKNASNTLSNIPASNSKLTFTPPTPSAAPGSLVFSSVSKTSMNLSWNDNTNNEIGYVLYNSTDNVNFNFVSQVTSNSCSVSDLLPNTNYYWQVYAVTEGSLSNALTGTKKTLPAGTIRAKASSNWNSTSTWDCNCIPSQGDDVIIPNAFTVTLRSNEACNSLTIGGGSSGFLVIGNNGTSRTLTVNTDIVINSGGTMTTGTSSANHQLIIGGDIINDGSIDLAPTSSRVMNVTFNKNGNQLVSGSGSVTRFNTITLDMGSSETNTLEITASNFAVVSSSFLSLVHGTFKLSTSTASAITPFNSSATIPMNTGIWINHAGATVSSTGGSLSLYGSIHVSAGTFNIGNAVNNHLISYGGTIITDGGTIQVNGCLTNGGANIHTDFTITSGTFKVAVNAPTAIGEAPFNINQPGSTFNMSGGTIIIGNAGNGNSGFVNTGSTTGNVSGGTLQMGDAGTPAGTLMQLNSTTPVGNLVIGNGSAITTMLTTNPLVVVNDLTIQSGTLNSNNLNINLGGNWLDNGTFTPGSGTVTLDGAADQSITGTSGALFNSLTLDGSGTKTLGSNITVDGTLSIHSTLDVSSSDFSIVNNGNWNNTGLFPGPEP